MRKNTLEYIMQRVEKTDGCWQWVGWTNDRGYGRVRFEGKFKQAHRIIYELILGEVSKDLVLDHLCRNRSCVNPKHLEPVTARENILRGESLSVVNSHKTHCSQGHEYTEESTYVYAYGRTCKICVKARKVEYRQRAKEAKRVLSPAC